LATACQISLYFSLLLFCFTRTFRYTPSFNISNYEHGEETRGIKNICWEHLRCPIWTAVKTPLLAVCWSSAL
jgi:hypothetical protein